MIPGCPDTMAENALRSSAIELCQMAEIYQRELLISSVADTSEYTITPPANTRVHKILWANYDGVDLEPINTTLLEQRLPKWRESGYGGTPAYFFKGEGNTVVITPVPTTASSSGIRLRTVLAPTHASTALDDDIMNENKDVVVNGALYRLLRIPGQDFTDFAAAQIYGGLFGQGVVNAERRGRQADTGVSRRTKYGGIYTSYAKRRNRYGRETA